MRAALVRADNEAEPCSGSPPITRRSASQHASAGLEAWSLDAGLSFRESLCRRSAVQGLMRPLFVIPTDVICKPAAHDRQSERDAGDAEALVFEAAPEALNDPWESPTGDDSNAALLADGTEARGDAALGTPLSIARAKLHTAIGDDVLRRLARDGDGAA